MGGVDILINNVGSIQKLAGFFDLSDEDKKEFEGLDNTQLKDKMRLGFHKDARLKQPNKLTKKAIEKIIEIIKT